MLVQHVEDGSRRNNGKCPRYSRNVWRNGRCFVLLCLFQAARVMRTGTRLGSVCWRSHRSVAPSRLPAGWLRGGSPWCSPWTQPDEDTPITNKGTHRDSVLTTDCHLTSRFQKKNKKVQTDLPRLRDASYAFGIWMERAVVMVTCCRHLRAFSYSLLRQ